MNLKINNIICIVISFKPIFKLYILALCRLQNHLVTKNSNTWIKLKILQIPNSSTFSSPWPFPVNPWSKSEAYSSSTQQPRGLFSRLAHAHDTLGQLLAGLRPTGGQRSTICRACWCTSLPGTNESMRPQRSFHRRKVCAQCFETLMMNENFFLSGLQTL